jgi:hypothetical protein
MQQVRSAAPIRNAHAGKIALTTAGGQQSAPLEQRACNGLQRHLPLRLPFFFLFLLQSPEQHWPFRRQRPPFGFSVQKPTSLGPACAVGVAAVKAPTPVATKTARNTPRRAIPRAKASNWGASMRHLRG